MVTRASSGRRPAPLPARFAAQLATLVKAPPTGNQWLHELKYDGYRIGCRIDRGAVRLLSRNGKDWTDRFPSVRAAAAELPVQGALLDGEVAVVLPDGRTSFQALQNAAAGARAAGETVYYVFDLLHLDGDDVSALPLEERKARLQRLLGAGRAGVIRFSDHVIGRGDEVFKEACRQGGEGIVSKRRDLSYQPGRGPGWVKTKCVKRQEFVIGGFTDPEGARAGIGALLIGVRDARGALRFAGKVGTGFTQASARALRQQLERLAARASPFTPAPTGSSVRGSHWVRPELVAEVAFTEWTADGKIRHPSFQGLREDKPPRDVVREVPVPSPTAVPPRTVSRQTVHRPRDRAVEEVAGTRLTHPDRVLYPDCGITKRELAAYYESIAEWVLPHLAGRPLTLVRCPTGIGNDCFFMKHSNVWAPEGLRRVRIREKTKIGEYLVADTLKAVIGLVQMDILEIHTWNSTAERLEEPDRIVLDLDPGPAVKWPEVIAAARVVRAVLDSVGLRSFVKNTGGRGVHVVVPLAAEADWNHCLAFARAVAEAVVRVDPRAYTTAFPKAGREHKILIDYLRNNRTNTSVAAFSTRAKPRAPVSVPLDWDELSPRQRADHFTIRTVPDRLRRLRADPWRDYWRLRQRVPTDAARRLASEARGGG
jgi:bifunctional non-homologous end joining protein LigD